MKRKWYIAETGLSCELSCDLVLKLDAPVHVKQLE